MPRARRRSIALATMAWPIGGPAVVAAIGDECAGAVPKFDDAVVFELAVGLGDGVGIDHQLLGERTDAGQLVAGAERAGFDGVLHLFHQLQVDGDAGGRIGAEHRHRVTVLLN
jgi:hypothetical protein